MLKQSDGSTIPISDISKGAINGASGTSATIAVDGTIQIADLVKGTDNNFVITYEAGNGQKISKESMEIKVDSNGNVKLTITLLGVTRLAGQSRVDTALAIVKAEYTRKLSNVVPATSDNYPDALAGSLYSANPNTSIILADGSLSDQVVNYLQGKKLTGATIFGGEAVVSQGI